MSRLMRQQPLSDNAYVEFRFESSLRKYERQPTKKVKCDPHCCNHCTHHNRKSDNSPFHQRHSQMLSKSKLKRANQNCPDGMSAKSIISQSKTIQLSKRKVNDASNGDENNLEKKIYESLMRNGPRQRLDNSGGENTSQMEDQVFLNDFQPSQDMNEEKEEAGDVNFGNIEIITKSINSRQELSLQATEHGLNNLCISQQREDKINEQLGQQLQEVLRIEAPPKQSNKQIEQSSVNIEEQIILNNKNIDLLQIKEIISSMLDKTQLVIQQSQLIQSIGINTKPAQNLLQSIQTDSTSNIQEQDNSSLHSETPFQNNLLHNTHLDKSLLAFQGGRIYIDSQGQHFYISARVFNKLRLRHSNTDQLISILIQQRPYLQSVKTKIKQQLQNYMLMQQ